MNNPPYNIYFDNSTGRVVVNKTVQQAKRNNSPLKKISILKKEDDEFEKKIEELYNFTNSDHNNKRHPQNIMRNNSPPRNNVGQKNLQTLIQQREIEPPRTVHSIIAPRPISPPKNISIQRPIIKTNPSFQRSPSPIIEKKNQLQNQLQNQHQNQRQYQNQNQNQNQIIGKNYFENNDDNKTYEIIENNDVDDSVNEENNIIIKNDNVLKKVENNNYILKKDLIYGIKKTILSDFNYLGNSSNSNDFIISLNKNLNKQNSIFDSFYLFPNISEINTKTETNIINEKKVDIFKNINNSYDIQYFPIDFVACGITIPLKSKNNSYSKLIIKNIFWNIFQSIDLNNYSNNELLCIIPNKYEFNYKMIELQINFELHSQVSKNVIESYNNKILPYKNLNIKSVTPANSCLFEVISIKINTLNGVYFDDIIINLMPELDIQCALLCIRISVPSESSDILKGIDKNNVIFYGNIPFSQFVLNFDYELC